MQLLKKNLDWAARQIYAANIDWVHCCEGPEGSGKTTLALQICKHVDPSFDASRVGFNFAQINEVIDSLAGNTKGKAILLDEGAESLFSRDAMKKDNRDFLKLFMRFRKLNLFVVLCIPSFLTLDRLLRSNRVKSLTSCEFDFDEHNNLKQGHFSAYSYEKVKQIAQYGEYPRPDFTDYFRFTDVDPALWKTVQDKNFAFLSGLDEERRDAKKPVSKQVESSVIEATLKLLGDAPSKTIAAKDVVVELKQKFGDADWLNNRFISRKMQALGLERASQSKDGLRAVFIASRDVLQSLNNNKTSESSGS